VIETRSKQSFGAIITVSMATTPFLMLLAGVQQRRQQTATNLEVRAGAAFGIASSLSGRALLVSRLANAAWRKKNPLTRHRYQPEQIDIHEQFWAPRYFIGEWGTRVGSLAPCRCR